LIRFENQQQQQKHNKQGLTEPINQNSLY